MENKVKAIKTIREFWFGKQQLTQPIYDMLNSNYQEVAEAPFAVTYESWFGRTFLIDYRFNQVTLVNRGYEVTTF